MVNEEESEGRHPRNTRTPYPGAAAIIPHHHSGPPAGTKQQRVLDEFVTLRSAALIQRFYKNMLNLYKNFGSIIFCRKDGTPALHGTFVFPKEVRPMSLMSS